MLKSATEVQRDLEKFCPELYPRVYYEPEGLKVRCRWALEFIVLQYGSPVEEAEYQMLEAVHEQIGKLTVLAQRLQDKQAK